MKWRIVAIAIALILGAQHGKASISTAALTAAVLLLGIFDTRGKSC